MAAKTTKKTTAKMTRKNPVKRTKKSRPTDRRKLYLGVAGELRVASELSLRGYITHMPAIDEGGDLFVVAEDTLTTFRVQVKASATANHNQVKGATAYQVGVKGSLLQPGAAIYFVFHCIHEGEWWTFVLSKAELLDLMPGKAPKGAQQKNIWIAFVAGGDVKLGGADGNSVKDKRDAWDTHFPVQPITGLDLTGINKTGQMTSPATGAQLVTTVEAKKT